MILSFQTDRSRQTRVNPDQNAPENFRIITSIFSCMQIFGILTVIYIPQETVLYFPDNIPTLGYCSKLPTVNLR